MDGLQKNLRLETMAEPPLAPDALDDGDGIQHGAVHIEEEGIVGLVENAMGSGQRRVPCKAESRQAFRD
jgi:hypothetical protein